MSTRHDMLVELVSDQINSIEQMIRDDEYDDVHHWLHPILLREMKLDCADWSDDDLKRHYCDQLGVDIPDTPPLSSEERAQQWSEANAQKEEELIEACFGKAPSQKTSDSGTVPQPSPLECGPLSGVYSIRNEESVAEMAATLRCIARGQANIPGIKPETEVRIPMRLLFRLVHGQRSIG